MNLIISPRVVFPFFFGTLAIVVSILGIDVWGVLQQEGVVQRYVASDNLEGGKNTKAAGEFFCSSTSEEISDGAERISLLLNNITGRPFFRFFKVNLMKECPYWAVRYLCTTEENSCQICSCDANHIPDALKYSHDMSDPTSIDSLISFGEPHPQNIDHWGFWKGSDEVYVDLLQNPEANTGYSGPLASRVWNAIYKENCMVEAPRDGELEIEGECKEEQVFRRLISGLHTSITMHIAAFYYKDKDGKSPLQKMNVLSNPNISFYPNCELYRHVMKNEEFVNNLYVLYQFILRALAKSKFTFLANISEYNSGEGGIATAEDEYLQRELQEFFDTSLLCSETFDEGKFFQSPKARGLVTQMKRMMLNITVLMDCVTCEKCRLWGKLQTMGLATALEVVMLSADELPTLGRGPKVSLINFARQLTVSVKNLRALDDVCRQLESGIKPKG